MDVSIVIPLFNEDESLLELHDWITKVMQENKLTYEIIFVDDGSTDNSWDVIEKLKELNQNVVGVRFRRNYGKSAGLNVGFSHAKGDVVVTMDADLQDSPEEIPALRKMIIEDGYHLVSGWKKKRFDPKSKTIPTKLFNWATRKMSGIHLHDFNCGLKAYSNDVVKSIEVYGEMHRYIPVIAKRAGFAKIGEKVVQHQARKFGVTKFGGVNRFTNGFLDLMTITFISKFGKRPMHFFGTLGMLLFTLGFILFGILGGYKIYAMIQDISAKNIADISWFYVALTFMIVGVQLFLAGFLGELISRSSSNRNNYQIKEKV